MASSVRRLALAVLVIVVVLISGTSLVGAARPDPAERSGDGGAYLAVYPAAERREMLMARLLAGPSRRGAGH
ncbi:hypothetical protein CFC21_066751 [Triticum aestivum]|uniref:Uncharacterized protein n=2 Tax=Triticum aestivum TaxID=4565 RepID=A0A9R1H6T1_WHEAT|nr:hypothetical protein CFC21_066751 [Triticum aestivum]